MLGFRLELQPKTSISLWLQLCNHDPNCQPLAQQHQPGHLTLVHIDGGVNIFNLVLYVSVKKLNPKYSFSVFKVKTGYGRLDVTLLFVGHAFNAVYY